MNRLDKRPLGMNMWPQIGHCTLRASVMGYGNRRATERELDLMMTTLQEALDAGANGFSTGGYVPGEWAVVEELIELSKVVVKHGGMYTTNLRRGGFSEAVEIRERVGIPVEVAHYDGRGIAETRARGMDVTYNAYPYNAGSSLLGQVLSFWVHECGVDAMLERIAHTAVRKKMKRDPATRNLS